MLDARLLAAASLVRPGVPVCDVGTDHGRLAVYLAQTGVSKRITASDVNSGPLRAARRTIAAHGLEGRIQTVLSNGLLEIPLEDAVDIVICGMGGELIARLILACPYTREPERRLILQPMTQAPYLRRTLMAQGFRLLREIPVWDRSRCYTVTHWQYDGVIRECPPLEQVVGKVPESPRPDAGEYLKKEYVRAKRIADGLGRAAAPCDTAGEWRALERDIWGAFQKWESRFKLRNEKEGMKDDVETDGGRFSAGD